jgi:hypothetical protein
MLNALDAKINAILPPRYQHCYGGVPPQSMGSAGLKFGPDGRVAWDEIWTSFCDLALAGGPPHRGTLLEPASAEAAGAEPEAYQQVVEEIARGIWLVTGLPVLPRIAPGWVGVICRSEEMAAWLVRAIVAENVSARHEQHRLYLPAGPHFRLEKEIKNVITALAKTCHYWTGHMSDSQQAWASATLYGSILLEPATLAEVRSAPLQYREVAAAVERGVEEATGLRAVTGQALGWIGFQCRDEGMAVWLLRAVCVDNILVRREGSVLLLPVSPGYARGDRISRLVEAIARAHHLWELHEAINGESPEPPAADS